MEIPTQARIAAGSMASPGESPRKGQILRDFALNSLRGPVVRLADYRGRSALILILSDEREETRQLMRDAADSYGELRAKGFDVLVVMRSPREIATGSGRHPDLPYPVLLDTDGRLHCELGAMDRNNRDAAAVYVTDMFGEAVGIYRTAEGEKLPVIGEVKELVEFISFQCPECEPPEWPV